MTRRNLNVNSMRHTLVARAGFEGYEMSMKWRSTGVNVDPDIGSCSPVYPHCTGYCNIFLALTMNRSRFIPLFWKFFHWMYCTWSKTRWLRFLTSLLSYLGRNMEATNHACQTKSTYSFASTKQYAKKTIPILKGSLHDNPFHKSSFFLRSRNQCGFFISPLLM